MPKSKRVITTEVISDTEEQPLAPKEPTPPTEVPPPLPPAAADNPPIAEPVKPKTKRQMTPGRVEALRKANEARMKKYAERNKQKTEDDLESRVLNILKKHSTVPAKLEEKRVHFSEPKEQALPLVKQPVIEHTPPAIERPPPPQRQIDPRMLRMYKMIFNR
jgi:hypothetical protein